ncbi:MAG: FecR domain-containing protein [Pyrinomonadaceae bacterium]
MPAYAAAAVAFAVLLSIGISWLRRSSTSPITPAAWQVQRVNGFPRIGTTEMSSEGQLAVGQWLETDAKSSAQIAVSTIGQVRIDPNTRIRLVQTQPTEHRLELAHGRLTARIWAPPRLFFVDTPSAVAADLGCAYTLEVDDSGNGVLHVTSGWVALQLNDKESMVPAGAACQTRRGLGPGIPYFEDASFAFRQDLAKVDSTDLQNPQQKTLVVDSLLKESRPRDTLTLWHLLARVDGADRSAVYEVMSNLVPAPDGVTRDGVLRLDHQMLDLWRTKLEMTWNHDLTQAEVKRMFAQPVADIIFRVRNGIKHRARQVGLK